MKMVTNHTTPHHTTPSTPPQSHQTKYTTPRNTTSTTPPPPHHTTRHYLVHTTPHHTTPHHTTPHHTTPHHTSYFCDRSPSRCRKSRGGPAWRLRCRLSCRPSGCTPHSEGVVWRWCGGGVGVVVVWCGGGVGVVWCSGGVVVVVWWW